MGEEEEDLAWSDEDEEETLPVSVLDSSTVPNDPGAGSPPTEGTERGGSWRCAAARPGREGGSEGGVHSAIWCEASE